MELFLESKMIMSIKWLVHDAKSFLFLRKQLSYEHVCLLLVTG